ncbi:MAG TPA: 50S ribosomal protein L18 [Candidatus Paceibacterota bacterium]|nr:50S ribosomal protein L18 [Candidatus Paceibacterota bacterium]HRZ34304.1 50S ribosomal protein L18 [Candidatus Paceibacterota bacterium]
MSERKTAKRIRRHLRIRAKISGTAQKPRLAISKSNSNMIAQLIDDEKGETLAYVWTREFKGKTLRDRAVSAAQKIAELAKAKKLDKVVFDRGGFKYIGNIKVFADAAREAGLKF